ncbi:MAG: leucyl aminopeptidase family protein [Pseudomonadota bacterium]
MHAVFAEDPATALPVHILKSDKLEAWLEGRGEALRALVSAMNFSASAGQNLIVPAPDGQIERVLFGVGDGSDPLIVAALSAALPEGVYKIASAPSDMPASTIAAAWADGAYRFTRYKADAGAPPQLAPMEGMDLAEASAQTEAVDLVRDLVNTPAADMGPTEIEAAARGLAAEHRASIEVIKGDQLLDAGYPMVHAVGRAAADAPRYIELNWGRKKSPRIAIVGKGVSFDTGGLNIKTGGFMRLMKKDMGGAAHALALAKLVMASGLDVNLCVAIPTVENAIGAGAFRPGDILTARNGLTVEVEDTDAEGRLILADALSRVSEQDPELVIDFATLTGAARVAMGAEVAPFFTDNDELAADISQASEEIGDPAWRLPMWAPYASQLSSPIADLKNLGDGPLGGSIMAALFLKNFVVAPAWVHWDVWAWRPAKFGRPQGAVANGLRAMHRMLKRRYRN